jgi:hypothetical protein
MVNLQLINQNIKYLKNVNFEIKSKTFEHVPTP